MDKIYVCVLYVIFYVILNNYFYIVAYYFARYVYGRCDEDGRPTTCWCLGNCLHWILLSIPYIYAVEIALRNNKAVSYETCTFQ
jgi:hypothetical protein